MVLRLMPTHTAQQSDWDILTSEESYQWLLEFVYNIIIVGFLNHRTGGGAQSNSGSCDTSYRRKGRFGYGKEGGESSVTPTSIGRGVRSWD